MEAQPFQLLQEMQQRAIIRQAMSIDNFLNQEAEEIHNISQTEEEITQDMLQLLHPRPYHEIGE